MIFTRMRAFTIYTYIMSLGFISGQVTYDEWQDSSALSMIMHGPCSKSSDSILKKATNNPQLERLYIFGTGLSEFPDQLKTTVFPRLKHFSFRANQFKSLPEMMGDNFPELQKLDLSNNEIEFLPKEARLGKLQYLDLSSNQLRSLEEWVCDSIELQNLYIRCNKLELLPDEMGKLIHLHHLNLFHNNFRFVPKQITEITQLRTLNMSFNQLTLVPDEIGNLTQLQGLWIYGNQITSMPKTIGCLTQLWCLDFSNNALESPLPDEICNLINLTRLGLSRNNLTFLPNAIWNLRKLESVDLCNNRLTFLPDGIENLEKLRVFELRDNLLTSLPYWIIKFKDTIELIDIRGNPGFLERGVEGKTLGVWNLKGIFFWKAKI